MEKQTKQNYGSAVSHWRWQRTSAMISLPLLIYCAYLVVGITSLEYVAARDFVGAPAVSVPISVLLIAGTYHSSLGVQVIIEDYVSIVSGRKGLIMFARIALWGTCLISLVSLIRITL
jgi:succinate dehydrogenase / fumarate reductase membrane anchor subunit